LKSQNILCVLLCLVMPSASVAGLFGYEETEKSNLSMFTQWLSVLERQIKERVPVGHCAGRELDQCHVKNWMNYLKSIRHLPRREQLARVNSFANQQNYILDFDNYGVDDYWATPGEFLSNHGDCEDYAIIKMMSLKLLGFDMHQTRLVVVQDTNLRQAHAVLAVSVKVSAAMGGQRDTLIMDNQIDEVVSHRYIFHYVPVYALNERQWWMFLPH